MDITQMSEQELKALAYDIIAAIQRTQNDLNLINQELIRRQNEATRRTREGTDGKEPEKKPGRPGDPKAKPDVQPGSDIQARAGKKVR
jgi:hypothetical protein